MDTDKIKLESSWKAVLLEEFQSDYMAELKKFLIGEIKGHKTIFPKSEEFFTALNLTPFNKVKVVILGQDPYHGEGQAHGLSFSVKPQVAPPPFLNKYL